MRLVCPNCGAQYEVDDRVIPEGGRDVQCSACGHGWYQMPPTRKPEASQDDASLDDRITPDEMEAIDEDLPDQADAEDGAAEVPSATPKPREVDTGVRSILREEAERELNARATEPRHQPEAVETQPDLGLDAGPSPEEERRRIARDRIARMRGMEAEDAAADMPAAEFDINEAPQEPERPAHRKDLFPDIEEINSTLDSHAPGAEAVVDGIEAPAKAAGGFGRGFTVMLALTALLVAIYILAPKLSAQIPALKPALTAYVEAINNARAWLDTTLHGVIEKIEAAAGAGDDVRPEIRTGPADV